MILVAPLQTSHTKLAALHGPPPPRPPPPPPPPHKAPSLPRELIRTISNTNRPENFFNLKNDNPSKLVRPRPDDPNCTHHFFRLRKSGSTAVYNAVMLDEHLHRFVCWTGRELFNESAPRIHPGVGDRLPQSVVAQAWHVPPVTPSQPLYPHPILVMLRHPLDLLLSELMYDSVDASGRKRRNWTDSSPVRFPTTNERHGHYAEKYASRLSDWVPNRGDNSTVSNDVFLCTDDRHNCPDYAGQLRRAFHEPKIKHIPLENVNHRVREVYIINERGEREIVLPNETISRLSSYVSARDLELWHAKCSRICTSSS